MNEDQLEYAVDTAEGNVASFYEKWGWLAQVVWLAVNLGLTYGLYHIWATNAFGEIVGWVCLALAVFNLGVLVKWAYERLREAIGA